MSKKGTPPPATPKKATPIVRADVGTPSPVTGAPSGNGKSPSLEELRVLAYKKWEAAGRPESDGIYFWLEAERELCKS
jgi:hypothetical protein